MKFLVFLLIGLVLIAGCTSIDASGGEKGTLAGTVKAAPGDTTDLNGLKIKVGLKGSETTSLIYVDYDGSFSVQLSPGVYTVAGVEGIANTRLSCYKSVPCASDVCSNGGSCTVPGDVTIEKGKNTFFHIEVDAG